MFQTTNQYIYIYRLQTHLFRVLDELLKPGFDACHHIVRQPPATVSQEPGAMAMALTMEKHAGIYHITSLCRYIYM